MSGFGVATAEASAEGDSDVDTIGRSMSASRCPSALQGGLKPPSRQLRALPNHPTWRTNRASCSPTCIQSASFRASGFAPYGASAPLPTTHQLMGRLISLNPLETTARCPMRERGHQPRRRREGGHQPHRHAGGGTPAPSPCGRGGINPIVTAMCGGGHQPHRRHCHAGEATTPLLGEDFFEDQKRNKGV